MSDFVPGSGAVNLKDILPPNMQNFSTRAQQEAFAKAEERRRNCVVRRDWETVDQHEARMKAFAESKKSQKPVAKPVLDMAPEIARSEYDRLMRSPDPKQHAARINELAPICGREFVDETELKTSAEREKSNDDRYAEFSTLEKWQSRVESVNSVDALTIDNAAFLKTVMLLDPHEKVQKAARDRYAKLAVGGSR
jgi:hypothetical protein